MELNIKFDSAEELDSYIIKEYEKRLKADALQHEVSELQKRVRDLENERKHIEIGQPNADFSVENIRHMEDLLLKKIIEFERENDKPITTSNLGAYGRRIAKKTWELEDKDAAYIYRHAYKNLLAGKEVVKSKDGGLMILKEKGNMKIEV